MITKEEIFKISLEKSLEASQVEKDYVLGWILAAISQDSELNTQWLFKGGTCLRKCFFKDYRYSEDLDFTIDAKEKIDIAAIQNSIHQICNWVTKESAIQIDINRSIFEITENLAKQSIIQGRIFYRGPISPTSPRQWPRIKFDLTADEKIVHAASQREIIHIYSDYKQIQKYRINSYDFYDLVAEKIRALFERTRPRDLYDVIEILNSDIEFDHPELLRTLKEKCNFKNMKLLQLTQSQIDACKAGWKEQLSKQLPNLPNVDKYLESFYSIYKLWKLDELL